MLLLQAMFPGILLGTVGDCTRDATDAGVSEEAAAQLLAESRELLHERRSRRPRPHLDDKVCNKTRIQ